MKWNGTMKLYNWSKKYNQGKLHIYFLNVHVYNLLLQNIILDTCISIEMNVVKMLMTSHLFLYFCFSIGDLQMVRNASILEPKKFVALSYTYYKLLFKKHYSGYVVSWKLKIFNFFLIYTQTCKSTIVEHAQFLTITFVQYLPKTVSSVILFFLILCALVHLFLN